MTGGDPLQASESADDRGRPSSVDRPPSDAGAIGDDRGTVAGNPYRSDGPPTTAHGFHGEPHPPDTTEQTHSYKTTPAGSPTGEVARKPRRSRWRAAVISALLGLVLVTAGLYLVGGFGARVFDAATNSWVAPTSDLVLATTGAVCLFVAVLLNGWSPWATALPGVILTGVGVWSLVSIDGAGRVAAFIDGAVGRGELIVSGAHIVVLVIGLLLLGASAAVTIARSAGRSRGRT